MRSVYTYTHMYIPLSCVLRGIDGALFVKSRPRINRYLQRHCTMFCFVCRGNVFVLETNINKFCVGR